MVNHNIVAAGPSQTAYLPGIHNTHLPAGYEEQAHIGLTILRQAWLVAIEDLAAAEEPGGVLAAASIRPAPRHAIALVADNSRPIGMNDAR
jgi:hypothetical protein